MTSEYHIAYIGLGSNITSGDKEISLAKDFLSATQNNVTVSHVYNTPSISGDGSMYFNAVARVQTVLSEVELDALLKQWEVKRGRTAEAKAVKVVVIDMDLVIYDSEVIRERDFVQTYFQIGFHRLVKGEDHLPE